MNKPDYTLIVLVAIFVIFGFLMLTSATAPVAITKYDNSYHYVTKQFLNGFLPGIILFAVLSRLDYRIFKKYSNLFFASALILLGLVFIPNLGVSYGKAQSWINVFGIFSFQPSEIAKLAVIIFFSAWLEYRTKKNFLDRQTLTRFLIILGVISGLIFLQPDMGTMFIIVFTALLIYFISGAPLIYFGGIMGAMAAIFLGLIKIAPYRLARLAIFLNPSVDPQGIGYHLNQALLAIGSGRFFGLGLGNSLQKFQYLPEVYADSIFAIAGEELGFIFGVLFIVGLVLFLIKGLRAAFRAPDNFGKFAAAGITGWIVMQSFINIGAMLSLIPITGLPLPFVSYGGTALATSLAACGILVNISRWA